MSNTDKPAEYEGIRVTKEEVREAVRSLQAQGFPKPGVLKLRAYIGHGSTTRIGRLRDEVMAERETLRKDKSALPSITGLAGDRWCELQQQLEAFRQQLQDEAKERVEEYREQVAAELAAARAEHDRLARVLLDREAEVNQLKIQLDQFKQSDSERQQTVETRLCELSEVVGNILELSRAYVSASEDSQLILSEILQQVKK